MPDTYGVMTDTVGPERASSPTGEDETARFERLYRGHLPRVLAYAMRRTSAPEVAEEVAAETFVIAWRRLDEVPELALPWLYGVARRLILNQRRGERRREALVAALGEVSRGPLGLVPEPAVGSETEDPALIEALDSLQPEEREAITLVAWEGLGYRDAAAAMGLSESAFSRRLRRARKRLARRLGHGPHAQHLAEDLHTTEGAGTT